MHSRVVYEVYLQCNCFEFKVQTSNFISSSSGNKSTNYSAGFGWDKLKFLHRSTYGAWFQY